MVSGEEGQGVHKVGLGVTIPGEVVHEQAVLEEALGAAADAANVEDGAVGVEEGVDAKGMVVATGGWGDHAFPVAT